VDLRNFFQLLRDHWLLIAFVTLLASGASAVLTARMTPQYASSVTFYVSYQANTAKDPIAAYEGALLSQQQVQSYADLLNGPRLAQAVVNQLGLTMTAGQLSEEIGTHLIPQTVLLTATVTDPSPRRAEQIAAAVGTQFVQLVAALERPAGKGPSAVRLTVVAPPALPSSPVSPQRGRNIGLAAGLGLLAGMALAAGRRSLDTTIKSADQLSRVTAGKPLIGTVPFDSTTRKYPLAASSQPFGHRAEAFRKIRTSLQFIDVDTPHKVLLFTSALPEEGKSSAVCNLAIAVAQSGKRVMVVEADLRRPRATGYLGLPRGCGVTSILVGTAKVGEAVQMWGDDEFAVLASGPAAPNPSELLGSNRMGRLLEDLRDAYDMVLVDAPPVLPFADALATGPACDGAILVVRHGKTRAEHVRRAADALAAVGVPLLGTVLSMTPAARSRGYGYGYGYGYRRYSHALEDLPPGTEPGGNHQAEPSTAVAP
jgi:capsular exopolysaccharide synthesis family protein